MRVPRKIKKAAKYVERHMRHSINGIFVIPYDEFVVKGRYTKWKQKCLNEVKRELRRQLAEEWQRYNGILFTHLFERGGYGDF